MNISTCMYGTFRHTSILLVRERSENFNLKKKICFHFGVKSNKRKHIFLECSLKARIFTSDGKKIMKEWMDGWIDTIRQLHNYRFYHFYHLYIFYLSSLHFSTTPTERIHLCLFFLNLFLM